MAISIELSQNVKRKLDKIAKDSERTRSQVIRLAIKKFVENFEKENGKSK